MNTHAQVVRLNEELNRARELSTCVRWLARVCSHTQLAHAGDENFSNANDNNASHAKRD